MNIIDVVIILLLVMGGIIGFKRGLIPEIVSLVGIILIFYLSFLFKNPLANFLLDVCPFIKFSGSLGRFSVLNIIMYQLIAFFIVFLILTVIFRLILHFTNILNKIINVTIILALPSKIGGFIVGVLKTYILIFILLLVLVIPLKDVTLFKNSTLQNKILYNSPILSTSFDKAVNAIKDIYNLGDKTKDDIKNNQNMTKHNLEAMKILLDYDIVSIDSIKKLINNNKINNIDGLDSLLKSYN